MKKTRLLSMTLVLNLTVRRCAGFGYAHRRGASQQQLDGAEQIAFLQQDWARIRSQVAGVDARLTPFTSLRTMPQG